jgi:hypothetical protein
VITVASRAAKNGFREKDQEITKVAVYSRKSMRFKEKGGKEKELPVHQSWKRSLTSISKQPLRERSKSKRLTNRTSALGADFAEEGDN